MHHRPARELRVWGLWHVLGFSWERVLDRRVRLAVVALVMLVCLVGSLRVNRIASHLPALDWDPALAFPLGNGLYLDEVIPFWSLSYLVYISFFLLPLSAAWFCPRELLAERDLLVGLQHLLLMTAFCWVWFLCLPVEITLRSEALSAIGQAPAWLQFQFAATYALDPPFTAGPSLHIVYSFFPVLLVSRWPIGRCVKSGLWLHACLVAASTLTMKQHFVVDVLLGWLLVSLVWRFATSPRLSATGLR